MIKTIEVAEFRAHNNPNDNMTKVGVIIDNEGIFFETFYGQKSVTYRNIKEAKVDISSSGLNSE